VNREALPDDTQPLKLLHSNTASQNPKNTNAPAALASVSGGEFRNTGFLVGWEIQTIYAGYSIPLSASKEL
jgi:hypothetical protein